MRRTEKDAFIGELQEKLQGASAFYLTDFTGLNVKQMTQFRARLRKHGVEYVVVKNTLAQRAVEALDLPDVANFFTGPTGLVIGREDAAAAAKAITDFAREFGDKPAVKVGVVDRREYSADEVKKLADMPPREVLLEQIAGCLQAPLARLAGGMIAILTRIAQLLEARRLYVEEHGLEPRPTLAALASVIDSWRLQARLDERQRNPSEPLKIGERYTLSVGFSTRGSPRLERQRSSRMPAIRAELVLLSSTVEFETEGPSTGDRGVNIQETMIGDRRMWTARTEIHLVGGGIPEIPRLLIRPKEVDAPRIELLMFAQGELYREASMILSVER